MTIKKRVVLIVIDGLGIGQMPDVPKVRPQDIGANTLRNVAREVKGLTLPNLEKMGLGNLVDAPGINPVGEKAIASFGKCMLKHFGADTYAGHQEIMGTKPRLPVNKLFGEVSSKVKSDLKREGYKVTRPFPDKPILLVNDAVVVADNIEADPGQNINVTAPLDFITFDEALKIGRVIRNVVKASRVIVFGGPKITPKDILGKVVTKPSGQVGVDTPALEIYNEHYMVCHMGYGIDPETQIPTLLKKQGIGIVLIGKMADVIECEGTTRLSCVDTSKVLDLITSNMESMKAEFIAATVQETDLAGHEQDSFRFAELLKLVDEGIGSILECLASEDVFIVTADHGNDPTIGHSLHTREITPLLITGKKIKKVNIGIRKTLADIGATIAEIFGIDGLKFGKSFYHKIYRN